MELANRPKSQLMKELQQWPRFQQMTLEEQGNLMIRLEDMRRKGREEAQWEAQQMGLKLSEEQMELFAEHYWAKKIAMMKKIQEEIEPRRKQLKAEMDQELRKEFGGK
jgi:cytochrome c553